MAELEQVVHRLLRAGAIIAADGVDRAGRASLLSTATTGRLGAGEVVEEAVHVVEAEDEHPVGLLRVEHRQVLLRANELRRRALKDDRLPQPGGGVGDAADQFPEIDIRERVPLRREQHGDGRLPCAR